MNNMNFRRAGGLHKRPDRQAAQQGGPVRCTQRWARRLQKSPPDRPFVLPAGPVSSEISDLLFFLSCFASQNKAIKPGNYFFDVCCVN